MTRTPHPCGHSQSARWFQPPGGVCHRVHPSRLGDYLAGRTIPSALVLLDLEDAAEQAVNRTWMCASDVIDAVAVHRESEPMSAMRTLLQGRDPSLAMSTPARRAIRATGTPRQPLTGPWKTFAYAILRGSARDGRVDSPVARCSHAAPRAVGAPPVEAGATIGRWPCQAGHRDHQRA